MCLLMALVTLLTRKFHVQITGINVHILKYKKHDFKLQYNFKM